MSLKSTRISKITTHTNTYGPLKLVSLDAQIETKKTSRQIRCLYKKSIKVVGHLKKGEKASGTISTILSNIDFLQDELIKLKEIYTKKL